MKTTRPWGCWGGRVYGGSVAVVKLQGCSNYGVAKLNAKCLRHTHSCRRLIPKILNKNKVH